ncbi:BTB/POZ domain-containing protein 9-like [Lineus longissimus]|uniref:BTB/POZ domain-containing protein 9-like n=1 Tax=Lineus longissimus TaxID=88925 RepID=UPI002B4C3247
MCDHHHFRSHTPMGDIEHTSQLSENIGALFENSEYSDVRFIVDGTTFHAHRVILAARSEYFRAMLFGGMKESDPNCTDIELLDQSAVAFKSLLKYIYTGKISLSAMKEEHLLDVLGLSHQYGFIELETAISDYLKDILNITNVCLIYDMANIYTLQSLSKTCFEFMDRNAAEVLISENFLVLSESSLYEVISRDSFCAPEIDIFQAVCSWRENNPEADISKIVQAVRITLMNIKELLNFVRPTHLVCPDAILDAIKLRTECRDMELNYRGFLVPDENVATLRHGALVIKGEIKAALLDGEVTNYDLDRGFSRHPIDENLGQGLVIKLGAPHIINAIRILLWDRDMRSYSYYIDVSMDERDWIRVIDHQKYLCRSWQNLHFKPVVAKYIKVVGTHNTVNRVFHCVAFECMYSNKVVKMENGLIVPTDNVATIEASANVIEGVSRSRNALINKDTKNYDWDSGYTCHQLGSGAIVVQLAQPFIIGSMRLLLWDCDDRSYSFTVEVSTDQQNWYMVADKSRDACKSWQTIVFKKRPVTFVRIVGTHNTANEVFHCVHFEAPADASALAQYLPPPEESKSENPVVMEEHEEQNQNVEQMIYDGAA